MRDVYKDGSMGEIRDLDFNELQKSLEDVKVDHVRVFNRETGGQIQIEINDLKTIISDAIGEALKKWEIMYQYRRLTAKK